MSYEYIRHEWKNETYPAINEDHLNEIEEALTTVFSALNNDVYLKGQGGEGLFTKEYKDMLDNLDEEPTAGHDKVLVSSAGVFNTIETAKSDVTASLTEMDTKVRESSKQVQAMSSAFGGEIRPLAEVAFSGSYNDLTDVPTPGGGGDPGNLAKVAKTGSYYDLVDYPTNLEVTDNKTTNISENSTDDQYPTAKAVYLKIDSTLGDIEKALAKL